jgi:hypothetical protein
MNHIREYHDMSPQGCRMFTGAQMTDKLSGQVLDDFTPGEVRVIVMALKSTGITGEVREYSINSDYFRMRMNNDPTHLRTTDVPELKVWSRDDETPTNNVFFREHGRDNTIDIFKTTDDYYWVDWYPGGVWLCDGLDSLGRLLKWWVMTSD